MIAPSLTGLVTGGAFNAREPKMAATFEKLLNGADGGLALLQVLVENSFDSVLITDASKEGKIIYVNKSFKKLTGHDPS